ncbi:lipid-A-disaccharide synthase [Thermoproteota archaeon]
MNILILAGEISGDIYGTALAKQLKLLSPDIHLFGVGGAGLKSCTDTYIYEIAHLHALGIVEVFQKRKIFKALYKRLEELIQTQRIDKVILIDFQFYNFKLARLFQKYNIPINTFITPNFWVWKDIKRAQKLIQYSEKIITIFKQEYEFYKQFTDKAYYFGHPLIELFNSQEKYEERSKRLPDAEMERETGLERKAITEREAGMEGAAGMERIITFFPGSREQELRFLLPVMIKTIKALQNHSESGAFHFIMSLSSPYFEAQIKTAFKKYGIHTISLVQGRSDALYKQTDVLVCASGTTTLEAMLHGVPMIVLGALSPLTYFIAKYIVRLHLPFIALPNIIAQKEIVPEFKQFELIPEKICQSVLTLLQKQNQEKMTADYEQVKKELLCKTSKPLLGVAECVLRSKLESG